MRPTIGMADVARRAGVSRTTASYVLNERRDVAIPEHTRALVRRAAEELGYRPNHVARSLVSRRSRTLGVIVPSLRSAFEAEIVDGVQSVCAARGYRMLLAYSLGRAESEREQVQLLLEQQVEGLINTSSALAQPQMRELYQELTHSEVACVVVDDRSDTLPVDSVASDDCHGARLLMQHLLALGHRRIGHLSGGALRSPARERELCYRQALTEAGLPVDEKLIQGSSFTSGSVRHDVDAMLALPDPPTALFAGNDYLAGEAWVALRERGRRVPADMALVGYGDQPLARYLGLTTVHQAPREMGEAAAEQLFARIQNPGAPAKSSVTPVRLVVRESCGSQIH